MAQDEPERESHQPCGLMAESTRQALAPACCQNAPVVSASRNRPARPEDAAAKFAERQRSDLQIANKAASASG
ncbi:MAG: hypothetical protein ACLSHC_11735 [Bilophila wadsworthia]